MSRAVYLIIVVLTILAFFFEFKPKIINNGSTAPQGQRRIVSKGAVAPAVGVDRAALQPGGMCNVETMNGEMATTRSKAVRRDASLVLTGWMLDHKHTRVASEVFVRLSGAGGEYLFPTPVGINRPDVVRYFDLDPKLDVSGFKAEVSIGSVAAGDYSLTLVMQFEDVSLVCDNGRKVSVS